MRVCSFGRVHTSYAKFLSCASGVVSGRSFVFVNVLGSASLKVLKTVIIEVKTPNYTVTKDLSVVPSGHIACPVLWCLFGADHAVFTDLEKKLEARGYLKVKLKLVETIHFSTVVYFDYDYFVYVC